MRTPAAVVTLALPPTVKRPALQIAIPALFVALVAAAIAIAAVAKADRPDRKPVEAKANVEARLAALESAFRSPIAPVITDWKAYAPTVTGDAMTIDNATIEGYYRRVGDSVEVQIGTSFTQIPTDDRGARVSGRLVWTLPMGLVFDDRKAIRSLGGVAAISSGVADEHICEADITVAGTGVYALCDRGAGAAGRTAQLTTAWPHAIAGKQPIGVLFQLRFPVKGWTAATP